MRKSLLNSEHNGLKLFSKSLLTFMTMLLMVINVNAQTGTVVDECTCLSNQTRSGNGQFETLLRITDGGAGPWYIAEDSIRGLYNSPSLAPPALPDEFTTGQAGATMTNMGGGVFELTGIHIDGEGYWVKFTDGTTDTLEFSVAAGQCEYPRTNIVGDIFVCEGQVVDYSTFNNPGSQFNWTLTNDGVNGGTVTTPTNTNQITVEWSDNSDGNLHKLEVEEQAANGCIVSDSVFVVIEDTVTLACNNLVQVSLDANCGGALTADMFLEGQDYEDESYDIIIEDENGNVIAQNTLSDDMIGKTYTITVLHKCSGNMCWSHMTVLDKTAPELECHTDTVLCSEPIGPRDLTNGFPLLHYTHIYNTSNPKVFTATGTTGCSDVTLRYYDNVENEDCNSTFTSTIIRNWIVTDLSGNLSTCVDTIRTVRTGLEDIGYPANWDGLPGNHDFIEACSNYPKDHNGNPHPDFTGWPTGGLCGNITKNYTDHKRLYLCGEGSNSYKVIRAWNVTDDCGGFFDTLQIIAVMDTKSPTVRISGLVNNTLVVNTDNYNCGSDVVLPVPRITDYPCSPPETNYTVSYQVADEDGNFPDPIIPYTTLLPIGGVYKIPDIPQGLARVKYTVKDRCGNTTVKLFFVRVEDNLMPQAVCDEHTTITLTDEGLGYLSKITFDDGSYDNCSEVTLRVRRMTSSCDPSDTQWGEGVHFCCDDTDKDFISVVLEVTDANGLKNTCMAKVIVQDKQKPTIICPSNGVVSCKFDYSDLSVFGTVRISEDDVQKIYINDPEHGGFHHYFGLDGYASDNCDITVEELNSNVIINNCGVGYISRRFRATDSYGNKSNICTQTINVRDFKPFNPNAGDLIWPQDYTYTGCLDANTHPDNLPLVNGWPRLVGEDECSMVAMDYDDLVFEHIDGLCYKILRTWRILDECHYDAAYGSGYWEHVQTIMINDNQDPIVESGCTPVSITSLGDCQYRYYFEAVGSDNCTEERNLRWSYKININNSPSDVITGSGDSFNATLSKGTHRITWTVKDECGNEAQCTKLFTVEDIKAPTPQCINGLVTVLLNETGEVTIHAADFNRNSTDDCTRSNYGTCGCLTDLRFSFSSNVYNTERLLTCDDIENGIKDTIELELWVTDESNNQDFCNTFIILQDNADVCDDVLPPDETLYFDISGFVQKPNDEELENVNIELKCSNPELNTTIQTSNDGEFLFTHRAEKENYTLQASKDGDYLNGVSTLDLVLIQKHILDIEPFESPYQFIAADANNSGRITAADILILRKLILGKSDKLSKITPWVFIEKDYPFEDENHPFDYKQDIQINNLDRDLVKNFVGIKIGDINYSSITENSSALENRNDESYKFVTDNVQYTKGENVQIPFYSKSQIITSGTQFTLEFDANKLTYSDITNGIITLSNSNINSTRANEGILTFSWNKTNDLQLNTETELFSINFTAINKGELKNDVKISSKITNAEIYISNKNTIEEKALHLEYRNTENYDFEVLQNAPNPFSDKTVIGFTLPENQMANLTIYDVTGKVLHSMNKECTQGYNEFEISQKDIQTTGIMYYKLEAGQYSALRKMILIK